MEAENEALQGDLAQWIEMEDESEPGKKIYHNQVTATTTPEDPRPGLYHNLGFKLKILALMKENCASHMSQSEAQRTHAASMESAVGVGSLGLGQTVKSIFSQIEEGDVPPEIEDCATMLQTFVRTTIIHNQHRKQMYIPPLFPPLICGEDL